MNALLACTSSGLKYGRAEVSDWIAPHEYLTVTQAPSPVTIVSLTRALQAEMPDLLIIIGHGGPTGIQLEEDGELLDYATLAPLIREQVPYLYLATCSSQQLADAIGRDTGAIVMCTIGDVYDKTAYTLGSTVAKRLGEGVSFEDAVRLSLSPIQDRNFKLVNSSPMDGGSFRRSPRIRELYVAADKG